MSKLVFRSSLGPWAVYTCSCQCDECCIIWATQEAECVGAPRYYVRHHEPLGCDPVRKGSKWDGQYERENDFESLDDANDECAGLAGLLSDFDVDTDRY